MAISSRGLLLSTSLASRRPPMQRCGHDQTSEVFTTRVTHCRATTRQVHVQRHAQCFSSLKFSWQSACTPDICWNELLFRSMADSCLFATASDASGLQRAVWTRELQLGCSGHILLMVYAVRRLKQSKSLKQPQGPPRLFMSFSTEP